MKILIEQILKIILLGRLKANKGNAAVFSVFCTLGAPIWLIV